MSTKVRKRDGRLANFDKHRIVSAIRRAVESTDGETWDEYFQTKADNIANYIKNEVEKSDDIIDIERVQDLVENGLMDGKRGKDVARNYIIYRNKRTEDRNKQSKFRKIIKEKLMATNVQNQNANVDEYSFGGRSGEASSEQNRQVAIEEVLSSMARRNHMSNTVYEHDLDHFVLGDHNCLSMPFDDLLKNGFNTRQTDVRPANSVNTAFQLVAVLFQLQSLCQFGGVSATHIDWTMVPYVRISFNKHYCDGLKYLADCDNDEINKYKNVDRRNISVEDKIYEKYPKVKEYAKDMTIKETYQAVEGMYHNLNTLQSRSGSINVIAA